MVCFCAVPRAGEHRVAFIVHCRAGAADDEEELRVDEDGKLHGCIHRLAQGQ